MIYVSSSYQDVVGCFDEEEGQVVEEERHAIVNEQVFESGLSVRESSVG